MQNDYQYTILELKPNDIVVLKFDIEKIPADEAHVIYKKVKEQFPNNQVIGITTDLEFMEWQKLKDFVESIKPKGETND